MTGDLYINGNDAYEEYGIFIQDGGYAAVMAWPALKEVPCNDWPEEEGVQVDLSNPRLDTRTLSIPFCGLDTTQVEGLLGDLADGTYHTFRFARLGEELQLRLVSQPAREVMGGLERFTLELADDFPLRGYGYAAPTPVLGCAQEAMRLDGRNVSEYGVWLLAGAASEMGKLPHVKPGFTVTSAALSGVIGADVPVRFGARDVTLNLHLCAPSAAVFRRNYKALLYDLVYGPGGQGGERKLHLTDREEEFPCYYKSATVSRCALLDDGSVWCDFAVTLCLTADPTTELLAAQDGRLVGLGDGKTCCALSEYAFHLLCVGADRYVVRENGDKLIDLRYHEN